MSWAEDVIAQVKDTIGEVNGTLDDIDRTARGAIRTSLDWLPLAWGWDDDTKDLITAELYSQIREATACGRDATRELLELVLSAGVPSGLSNAGTALLEHVDMPATNLLNDLSGSQLQAIFEPHWTSDGRGYYEQAFEGQAQYVSAAQDAAATLKKVLDDLATAIINFLTGLSVGVILILGAVIVLALSPSTGPGVVAAVAGCIVAVIGAVASILVTYFTGQATAEGGRVSAQTVSATLDWRPVGFADPL